MSEPGIIYQSQQQATSTDSGPTRAPPARLAAHNNTPRQPTQPAALLPAGGVVISARALIAGVVIASLIIFLFLLFWESFGKEAAAVTLQYGPTLQMRSVVPITDYIQTRDACGLCYAEHSPSQTCRPSGFPRNACHPSGFPPQACDGNDPCPNSLGWPNYGGVETPGDGEEIALLYQRAASAAAEIKGAGGGRHSRSDLPDPSACDTDMPSVRGRTTYAGYRHSSALL